MVKQNYIYFIPNPILFIVFCLVFFETYPPTTFPPTSTTTKLPCYSRLTCFDNSILNLSTCQCDCKPGFYFDYTTRRCLPYETTTIPPTTTKAACNLDCRAGSLVVFGGICQCICYEFYVFNGTSCYLCKLLFVKLFAFVLFCHC